MHRLLSGALAVAAFVFSANGAKAQYNVTDLNTNGTGLAISTLLPSVQAGTIQVTGQSHAATWSGKAASLADLNPSGYTSSAALGAANNSFVGSATSGLGTQAMIWTSNTPFSASSLAPIVSGTMPSTNSVATGTNGSQEVGYAANSSGNNFAFLWTGPNPNGTNLNPTGYSTSEALAIYAGSTVGYAQVTAGNIHAILWNGSATNFFDLHPSGYTTSVATAIFGTTEVGYVTNSGISQAYLWHGTSNNGTNLNPTSPDLFANSQALGISGSTVVGYGAKASDNKQIAMLWNNGTANSYVNLSAFLPAGATNAEATGIDSSGDIIGYATLNGTTHAYLWTPAIPPAFTSLPQNATTALGLSYSFTFTASGNFAPTFSLTSGSFPNGLTMTSAGVLSGTPTKLGTFTGTITASNGTAPNATQNFSITVVPSPTFQLSTVANCVVADGSRPFGIITQGADGNFYNTADGPGNGTVFEMVPGGNEVVVHKFGDGSVSNDGQQPLGGVIQGTDGNFYGTTFEGGSGVSFGSGTVFKIASGVTTILHNFPDGSVSLDGRLPVAALVQGKDGSFYGVTGAGGTGNGYGTVFNITSQGTYSILHRFDDGTVLNDGSYPTNPLIQASDGNFYGTTSYGGTASGPNQGGGTIFKMTPAGAITILHSFADGTVPNDGNYPISPLVQARDGNFYGITGGGGVAGRGVFYKMTPGGTVTILHSFGDGTVGNDPQFYAGSLKIYQNLVQGPDGNFYSTSKFYGSAGLGTLFQITPQGTMLVLHSFGDGSVANDGNYPPGNLVLGSDGNFYGMTEGNYPNVDDVLFKFSIQSAPVITSSALTATATAGASYTFTCAALGSPAPTFSATPGTLPNGLTISSTGGISGTPTTPGTFTGTITAGNGIGTPATQSFTITVTDTYSAWATRNGLSGPAAAMTAVTANDGLNNLYKYSLGLAPATTYNQGDSHLPLVSSAANYLSLTFSGVATDVTYTVQASSDLTGAWTTIQTFPSGGVAPGTQTVQDTQSMSASSQRYMRLLMSSP